MALALALFATATLCAQENTEDWAAIERESRGCLQKDPVSTNCVVRHAEALSHLGQPYDGILQLDSFLGAHPDAVLAVLLYSQLLQKVARDSSAAETALRKTAQLAPGNAAVWQALAALYAGEHKAQQAIECYQKALHLSPDDPLLLAGEAYSRYLNGEAEKAQEEFKRAMGLNRQLKTPLVGVPVLYGAFLRDSGQASESIAQFTTALELNARLWQVYYERSLAYERSRNFAAAEKDALTALKGEGDRRDIRLLLLRIYRAQGDSEKVAEQTAAVQKLNQTEDMYYTTARALRESLNQAEAAVTKGDCAAAVTPYERVVQLMPTFYEAWFPLGVCYNETGNRQKAEQALKTYLRYQPLSADGHSVLGLIYLATGRTAEAEVELRKALDLDSSEVEAAASLAQIEYGAKRYNEAARLAAQALSPRSDAAASTYAVAAESNVAIGDRSAAMGYLETGLKKWPEDEELQRAHAALLTSCLYAEQCKTALFEAVRQHPASLAYRKAAVKEMVMTNPWDPQTQRAVDALAASLPRDAEARLIEAIWQERRNRTNDAITAAREALAMAPEKSTVQVAAWDVIGRSCEAMGDLPCARKNFQNAWQLDSLLGMPDPSCGVSWAEFLEQSGDRMAALSVLDEVVRSAPAYAAGYLARAKELAREKNEQHAIEDASQALRITDNPELQAEAHALLAKLYAATGKTAQAKQHQDWIESHR